jgi:hypothetical protein
MSGLLSSFALGPSWARATGGETEPAPQPDSRSAGRPPRRDDRGTDDRRGDSRDRDGGRGRDREGARRPFQGRGERFDERRAGPPRDEEAPPAEGVRVTLIPDAQAVHLIGKEIHQVARVYPLYDVAKILLAERARCRAVFEAPAPHAPLFRGKLDETVFLTRDEALGHLWQSELRNQFIEEETIEVAPPTGNFLVVARCGMSGEWLGPPNFHSYQINLRRLHRERFSNMPFAVYSSRVRTERGEEAVTAWLETMKKKTHWRIKGDADDAWIEDRTEAERALAARCFEQAFAEVRTTEVLASIPPRNLSPSLLTSLKLAGNHARNHPAILIPAVCRAVEAEHLPVFKRQGKLLTGPARPHPLPQGAVLAERPGIMVDWIRANKLAKLEGLWKAVLPEGSTAPPAEFAADLFWLLHQGHILLFTDDTLVVQEIRDNSAPDQAAEPKDGKARKKKKKSNREIPSDEKTPATLPPPEDEAPTDEVPADEVPADEVPADEALTDEAPTDEAPTDEAPTDEALTEETPTDESLTEETPREEIPAKPTVEETPTAAAEDSTTESTEENAGQVPAIESSESSESSESAETEPSIPIAEPSADPPPSLESTDDDELSKNPSPGG